MTPEELGERLAALAAGTASVTFGEVTVDVPRAGWVAAVTAARDDPGLDLSSFDWLSGVDELDAGFAVVLHVFSVRHRHRALLRTRVPRDDARLDSLVGVFPGAAWHERETYEMFGVGFDGHPHLVPLLLPDGFDGHPLRKDFVLAARVAKEWPGAKEPGESHTGATRRRMRPPGVPGRLGSGGGAGRRRRPPGADRAERRPGPTVRPGSTGPTVQRRPTGRRGLVRSVRRRAWMSDAVEIGLKAAAVLAAFLLLPLLVGQLEHKAMAHMQSRVGPMYAGGFHGWAQLRRRRGEVRAEGGRHPGRRRPARSTGWPRRSPCCRTCWPWR